MEARPAGFQGQPTDGFWKVVLQLLAEIGDVRQLPRLEAVLAQVEKAIRCHADTLFRVGLPPLIERLRELTESAPEENVVPVKPDLTPFFTAVYANPDADEARAVLADQLLEAGDPRGELISLQLKKGKQTREAKKRCRELVAAHGTSWTGALAPAVRKEGLEFRRGFVHACRIGATSAAIDVTACPELSTVEELTIATGGELPSVAWGQARALRVLGGLCHSVFNSPVPLTRLTELDLKGSCDGERVVACSVLPALSRLRLELMLHGPERFALWRSPLAAKLTSVWLGSVFGELAEWRAWMEAAPAQVEKMSVGVQRTQLRLTLRRVEAGFKAEVLVSTHGSSLTGGQEAVDAAVELAGTELALAGLERCAAIELTFRPNTRGPGWPATHLPPSIVAAERLKARWVGAEIRDIPTQW